MSGDTPLDGNDEKKPAQAERLVRLALELFTISRTITDEPFALRREGPRIAMMFRGSRDALRSTLAREYRTRYGSTPSASALADAMTALQGEALDAAPCDVHLRIAEHDGGVLLDLGRHDGRIVYITATGWQVLDRSPAVFRRSALTGELPIPEHGGNIEILRRLIHVTAETWEIVLGWIIAAYLPKMPHPVLMLGGEQGSGKTTTTRTLVSLVDPSPALVRSQPSDPDAWGMAAAGSWVVAVDNVSTISAWWSDSICKAVTGDGLVRRKLYTDSELAVLSFRRVIALTSIDAGALRGDLGDRILLADLEPIAPTARRSEEEIDRDFRAAQASILGALLDVLAAVLRELPGVRLAELPRMADFAKLLAAMDSAIGTDALRRYHGQKGRIAEEVVDGDAVAGAIRAMAGDWTGTAAELLRLITSDPRPQGWPKIPRTLVARLKRLAPALREAGITVTDLGRGERGRMLSITSTRKTGNSSSASSASSATEGRPADDGAADLTMADDGIRPRRPQHHRETDDHDDNDDQLPVSLGDGVEVI